MSDKESSTEVHLLYIQNTKQSGDAEGQKNSNVVSYMSYIARGEDRGSEKLEFDLASGKLTVVPAEANESQTQANQTSNPVVTKMAASGFYLNY